MIPAWLTWLSLFFIAVGVISALAMVRRMRRNPPHMKVMAFVWPLCALFGGPVLLWFQSRYGGHDPDQPFPIAVAKGALHCGAGCSLGDIIAESTALALPAILTVFGLGTVWSHKIFATWTYDYVWAFGLGIIFQYFAIAPMRGLGLGAGLRQAVKADAASLTSWQVGLYGFMAIAHFLIFPALVGAEVTAADPLFWFAMQIAMLAGFATAYPVNWWLIRSGIKERM